MAQIMAATNPGFAPSPGSPHPDIILVTIDTEGDDLWSRPREVTTHNACHAARFQRLCEEFGFRLETLKVGEDEDGELLDDGGRARGSLDDADIGLGPGQHVGQLGVFRALGDVGERGLQHGALADQLAIFGADADQFGQARPGFVPADHRQQLRPRAEEMEADFVGFDIGDEFVIGYGLDYAERYRNLPYVGVLHPDLIPGAH